MLAVSVRPTINKHWQKHLIASEECWQWAVDAHSTLCLPRQHCHLHKVHINVHHLVCGVNHCRQQSVSLLYSEHLLDDGLLSQDSQAMLWDLNEGKHLYTLDGGGETINALCFSPNRYWLCAATGPSIKIWVRVDRLMIVYWTCT